MSRGLQLTNYQQEFVGFKASRVAKNVSHIEISFKDTQRTCLEFPTIWFADNVVYPC